MCVRKILCCSAPSRAVTWLKLDFHASVCTLLLFGLFPSALPLRAKGHRQRQDGMRVRLLLNDQSSDFFCKRSLFSVLSRALLL